MPAGRVAQEPVFCRAPMCGKPLRSKKSRARGYGRSCFERLFPKSLQPRRITVEKVSPSRGRDHSPQPGPDLLDELEQQS